MKRYASFLGLALLASTTLASTQCDALRATQVRLLPGATFEVNHSGLLNGCFAGYLPENVLLHDGLYRFGVFRDNKLIVPFPVIEAGRDLSSNPYRELKILAVSFNDLDSDGQRDVMVIGKRLMAKGEQTFVQIYWACGDHFVYDDKTNSEIIDLLVENQTINVKTVQQYIRKKKLKATCGSIAEKPIP